MLKKLFCWIVGHRWRCVATGQKSLHDGLVDCWVVNRCDRCTKLTEGHKFIDFSTLGNVDLLKGERPT